VDHFSNIILEILDHF